MAIVSCGSPSNLVKMSILGLFVVFGLCQAAYGEFIVAHAPDYLKYTDSETVGAISTSEIPDLITSSFGYSVSKGIQWNGLKQTSMFRRPKASVLISVEGHTQPLNIRNLARYASNSDDGTVDTESVVDSIQAAAGDSQPLLVDFSVDNTIFDVKSHYPELFKQLPATYAKVKELFVRGEAYTPQQLRSLNITQDADLLFLGELHVIQQIILTLKSRGAANGKIPDFYHLKVSGLAELAKVYGENSEQVRDGHALLETILDKLTQDLKEIYSNNVVVHVISAPPRPLQQKMRYARSLLEDDTPEETAEADDEPIEKKLHYAEDYDSDYPVIFNIILWTMVILAVALIAISCGMWNMDPGRDSIIYRMTSQRIKKD